MKRICKLIITMLVSIMFIITLPKYDKGDVNNDGVLNYKDIVKIQRYILGLDDSSLKDKYYLDANSDFVINEKDIEYVQHKIMFD